MVSIGLTQVNPVVALSIYWVKVKGKPEPLTRTEGVNE